MLSLLTRVSVLTLFATTTVSGVSVLTRKKNSDINSVDYRILEDGFFIPESSMSKEKQYIIELVKSQSYKTDMPVIGE